ncbi:hypothetical protein [Bartonella ancashensis]|uniref:Uncharacterized protein n=1 Tax=Bartonella ancashensis TaxID=1318743 RepID=A0A0M3T2W3_9HYPH|nr:hypothetical protein [Bartonella ancashensis]ALE03435.1 hypothetical protein PU02_0621 [Bartonella ancashensis]
MAKSKRKKRTKRARCGRSRIEGCMREPNGRISRARKSREPIDQLAIQMRMKHLELTYEEAKNPLSGSYIGRLYLLGGKDGLSQEQYDVAQQYLVVEDQSLPHLVGSLRIVLNALQKHFYTKRQNI